MLSACAILFSVSHLQLSRVEQLFSKLKTIKTDQRTNLNTTTLHDLFEIKVEGPPLELFNADAAVIYGGKIVPVVGG